MIKDFSFWLFIIPGLVILIWGISSFNGDNTGSLIQGVVLSIGSIGFFVAGILTGHKNNKAKNKISEGM